MMRCRTGLNTNQAGLQLLEERCHEGAAVMGIAHWLDNGLLRILAALVIAAAVVIFVKLRK